MKRIGKRQIEVIKEGTERHKAKERQRDGLRKGWRERETQCKRDRRKKWTGERDGEGD